VTVSDEEVEEALLSLLRARGPGRTLDPQAVARALAGGDPDRWGPLMQPVRRAAVRLMKQGRAVITRRGRPVDPDQFKGTYRIVLPDEASPPGAAPAPPGRRRSG